MTRPRKFLLAVLILAATGGCDRGRAILEVLEELVGKVLPDPRFDPRTTPIEADFVVSGDDLYYKGQRLPLLEDVQKLIAVFGKNYRKLDERLYAWDELGVYCFKSSFSDRVVDIGIRMRNYPADAPIWTKKLYEKDIVVEGAVINKDAQVWQFNKGKKGEWFKKRRVMYYEYYHETTVAGIQTSVTFRIQVDPDQRVHDFNVYVSCDQC